MTDVKMGGTAPLFRPDFTVDTRLAASLQRLLAVDYAVGPVIEESMTSDWPGDVAGRLLLSLTRMWRSGAPTEVQSRALYEAMLEAVNPQGYFGPELGDAVDEQQLACQGWVVSGLLQYFRLTDDPQARVAALKIVDNLMLPALRNLGSYPRHRQVEEAGAPSGTLTSEADGWVLSSDTWCVLLVLNGLVPAFAATRREDILQMIGELRDLVLDIDVREQRAQLHAVLAAARNFAQLAEETGDVASEELAVAIYDSYARHARTLNFATWNWFERPHSWTEPCAIADSLGLALGLWRLTGEERYLTDAQLIEVNGLGFAQRADGSFGLDSVATDAEPILTPIHPDARWCCTMRGAVGLIEARDESVTYDESSATVSVFTAHPGVIRASTEAGEWRVREETHTDSGRIAFTVEEAPQTGRLRLEVRTPDWSSGLASGGHNGGSPFAVFDLPPQIGFAVEVDPGYACRGELLANGQSLHFFGPHLLAAESRGGDERDGAFPGYEAMRRVDQLPNPSGTEAEPSPRYRLAFSD